MHVVYNWMSVEFLQSILDKLFQFLAIFETVGDGWWRIGASELEQGGRVLDTVI